MAREHDGIGAVADCAGERSMHLNAIIVEDERSVGDLLQVLAEECGFRCRRAASADAADQLIAEEEPDLILLDLRLPDRSGKKVLKQYRERGGDAPVIVISAIDDIFVRLELFAEGADDFIVKPFEIKDVQARIRAVMRRSRSMRFLWRNDGHFRLDPATCSATYDNRRTTLTPIQFGITWILAASNERLVGINELCLQLFDNALPETVANCHTHISKARKKLDELGPDIHIRCTVGVGYSLVVDTRSRSR